MEKDYSVTWNDIKNRVEKWLKERKGRVLTREDISYFIAVVGAIEKTCAIMIKIDSVIGDL